MDFRLIGLAVLLIALLGLGFSVHYLNEPVSLEKVEQVKTTYETYGPKYPELKTVYMDILQNDVITKEEYDRFMKEADSLKAKQEIIKMKQAVKE